ncbi:MAG: hypothetical protein VCD33_14040 [Alphaproteobacteria bacterium]
MASGDTGDIRLFQLYEAAFKGARQLTWSKGLKDCYQVDQASDNELAAMDDAETVPVAEIAEKAYQAAARAGAIPEVLEAAERAGYISVWVVFKRLGLVWGVQIPADITERGYYGPAKFAKFPDENERHQGHG